MLNIIADFWLLQGDAFNGIICCGLPALRAPAQEVQVACTTKHALGLGMMFGSLDNNWNTTTHCFVRSKFGQYRHPCSMLTYLDRQYLCLHHPHNFIILDAIPVTTLQIYFGLEETPSYAELHTPWLGYRNKQNT